MNVEPSNQDPNDDESVAAGEQTADIDYSHFELSHPPSTEKSRQTESKREPKDQTVDHDGAATPVESDSNATLGDDPELLMSILDVEKNIQQKPEPAPRSPKSGINESETADDTVGSKPSPIGRYKVRRLLGQGAFGRVYEAHDPQLDRRVAVKVSKDVKGKSAIDRFLREARSAAHLRHPAIIPVYEYGQAEGLSMIVYELVDGETLRSYINRNAPLELSTTVSIIRKIAEGLDYAHGEGIIHRDMKPDNVLMDQNGEPHIADFGCARRFDDQDTNQTLEGSVLGTPMYMSPEQASGHSHEADGRTDVWSMGVMLYEMVSGRKPFEGKLTDVMHLIRHHDAKPLRKVHPSTPLDIETICSKCLRRELDYRFATAGELADELERFERGEPIESRRISVLTRTWLWAKRNRAVAGLLSAVVTTLLIGFTVSMIFWLLAVSAQKNHARTLVTQLKEAESEQLPGILDIVLQNEEWSRNYLLDAVRTDYKNEKRDTHQRLRLKIVLMFLGNENDQEVSSDDLDDLLMADGDELLAFCGAFSESRLNNEIQSSIVQELWKKTRQTSESSDKRFRAACALAQLVKPDAWDNEENVKQDVAGYLTAMNINQVQPWLPVVKPVYGKIENELEDIFDRSKTENSSAETAAAILAYNIVERELVDIVDLVQRSNSRQLALLMTAIEADEQNKGAIGQLFFQQLEKLKASYVEANTLNERIQNASSQANLILALIGLGHPDAWMQLERSSDNTVSTEVIERLEPASTSVDLLLSQIENWKDTTPDALAAALLALPQYSDGQIPVSNRRAVILPMLQKIFENHWNARVHSSARWLMTQWEFDDEVRQLESELRQQWPDPEKNWHVDLNGITFVVFNVKDFEMGKFDWPDWPEKNIHRFGICIHEVTDRQFVKFVDSGRLGGSEGETEYKGLHDQMDEVRSDKPVEKVRYYWALAYCRWLTKKTPLDQAVIPTIEQLLRRERWAVLKQLVSIGNSGYRLPTGAEWEYACRVKTSTERSFGREKSRLSKYAWYSGNSTSKQPVAQLKPNEAGLFDMLGNVSEFCLDTYLNDEGIKEDNARESRGGSYDKKLDAVDSFTRRKVPGINLGTDLGFRLARTYPSSQQKTP